MKKSVVTILTLALLFMVCLSASATTIYPNRYASVYDPAKFNNSFMQYRMNCYGYASQLYYMGSASSTNPYKQQPAEFAHNHGTFASLSNSYLNAMTYWNNMYAFVKDRVFEDYSELGWSIWETSDAYQAPSGYRKIAMVIRQDGYNSDYHFYLQHSDGTWSHKPGSTPIRNTSFDTGALLTNANIAVKAAEGGYDDGLRFFIIGKDAVTDYPHSYGQTSTATYTPINFKDKAGDSITQATTITGSTSARLDYAGDKDFYTFTPSTSKTYTISTSMSGAGYDVDGVVYDNNGNVIASDSSTGSNASFTVYLNAGVPYYIGMWDMQNHVIDYTLYVN